ncbi:response regulator [Niastella caeni]|uniref:histidine kinase n=1 Tax=Niastella caeni TaxID=2569763 RepID=A0A4S8HWZ1_9BACT|nr:two-component regulator propeller domain-containing protein [Niastella caeni]THU40177.1 response regulator [Niastella caeni]
MKSFFEKIVCFVVVFQFLAWNTSFAGYPVSAWLGIDQGLSNNFVRCIYQDKNGFMWFGTYDGLNRYDGYEFKIFRNNLKNNRTLINNWINTINEDAKGNLWIGTRQGACVYQSLSNNFSFLYYYTAEKKLEQLHSVVNDIEADLQGNMFAATAGKGLIFYKKGESVGYRIPLENEADFPYDVTSVKAGNDKNVWLFVSNKGLYVYEYKTNKAKLVNATIKSANCIEAANGYLYIGTNNGMYRYNIASNSFDKVYNEANKKLNYNTVAGITASKNNELWVATNGGGVVIVNTGTDEAQFLSNTREPNSLSSNAVYSIWIDRQSRKWIGTLRGGINVIDPNKERFQNIVSNPATTNTLISNHILSFYEAPNNDLWIGTDGGGLSIWNRRLNQFTNYRHDNGDPYSLSDNFVTDIQSDFQNNLWMTTYRGGVNRFNNGKFEHYNCVDPDNTALIFHPIGPNLLEDADKKFWLSTQQYGLFKLNRQKKVFELFDDRLKHLYVLKEDRNHIFWGGGIDHLVKIDREGKKHVSYYIGKPVSVIMEDRSNNFWVGTEGGGLILFDRKQGKIITRYTTDEGLCSNSILTILEDAAGNLWMSTFNGIAKFNPKNKTFKNYYKGDGLQSNQFNYHAALKLRSGEFAFGGIKGFSLFRPESITTASGNPKIFLTDVKIANTSVEKDSSLAIQTNANRIELIEVPYNRAVLSFEFAALEYSAPDKIQYAYYMQGSDKDWSYCGNTRKVVYSHLSEGRYTFRVKNTNAEGQWNKDEVQIEIIVLPPWYRTWWAYLMYTVMIGAAVYFYLQYRSKQTRLQYEVKIAKLNAENERSEKERSLAELAAEKAELEKERAEREREHAELEKERILNEKEREINEKKISFFTNISHEFRTPLTLIINPVKELLEKRSGEQKDRGDLNIVYRNARRMLSLVDQLLLFRKAESGLDKIKPSKLNLHDVAYEVYLCFIQQAKTQHINYVFDCTNKNVAIYADREKLEIILYNLLSNALKYTATEGSIRFSIVEGTEDVVVKVEDNGAGIPAETGEKLFDKFYKAERTKTSSRAGFGIGLFLVKHFTELHYGTISYESEEGQGTTFTLSLQKGKDHFGAEVIISETEAAPQLLEALKEEAEIKEDNESEEPLTELVSEKQSILVIDDDESIRQYLVRLFKDTYIIYQAENGEAGLAGAQKYLPDLIISDIHMKEMSGIELCKRVKENGQLSHIPVILLTGATSDELRLQGVEGGADDYIVKPFDSKLLVARVTTLLKNRNTIQKYFLNEITLNKNDFKVSPEYKEFLDKCISIVEKHLKDKNFSVQTLLNEMGMSHSNLLRKIKSVSGQPVNIFIRSIRLRKAAELFINSDYSIKETAYTVGIRDIKYFREQFNKLFGMNPSDYVKKYRQVHGKQYTVDKESLNPDN